MNRPAECISCLITNRVGDLREARAGEEAYSALMFALSELVRRPRTEAFAEAFRLAAEAAGEEDLYKYEKEELNAFAQDLLTSFEADGLGEAELMRIGAAANAFDTRVLGYQFSPGEFDFKRLLEPPAVDDSEQIDWESVESIAYVPDNSGEFAVDALIMKKLSELGYRVLAVAREDPYEIDVTAEDLRKAVGGFARVVASRGNAPPLYRKRAGREAVEAIEGADLVVAKGIANLEAYIDSERWLEGRALFLLRAKCPLIARAFGAEKGAPLVVREERVWSSARRMKRDSFPME